MSATGAVRVLLGDMSRVARTRIIDLLKREDSIVVAGELGPDDDIVAAVRRIRPHLVLIGLGGAAGDPFETTKRLMVEAPTPLVILDDGHKTEDVQASVLALRSGALSVLQIPRFADGEGGAAARRHFVSTLRALSEVKLVRRWRERALTARPQPPAEEGAGLRAVAIAASTGGPAALERILTELPGRFEAPILVVQHIAHGFIEGLAQWLNSVSALTVKIAAEGEPVRPRTVYLAPDGYHLGVSRRAAIDLSDGPPVGGFRPAADHLFESAARAFGPDLTAVVLTGMGQDGVAGLRMVRQRGGSVIAQDEATCVVYGMPKAAFEAGLVDEKLPLNGIAARLMERIDVAGPRR
jgi:two-component system chemotaxis response regulator CheB